jgi:7-cyano-7-deazaguanine reductase
MDESRNTGAPSGSSARAPKGVPGAAPGGPGAAPDEPYGTAASRQNKLERWPNPEHSRPYMVSLDLAEFTCLCPRSGFPDFALIKIRYQPRDWIVELKSLKLYINGYRDSAVSHEAAANQILDDLVTLLEPRWMRVTADFSVRGNIKTVVRAEHGARERT